MPRFSPRGYANGGLADTVGMTGMTGMTGMAGMAAPVDMSMEFEEEITPVGDVVSEDVFVSETCEAGAFTGELTAFLRELFIFLIAIVLIFIYFLPRF